MTLNVGSVRIDVPLIKGTEGKNALDLREYLQESGLHVYDPGFSVTAAAKSEITFIDGDRGILRHRGYPIEVLAEKKSFLELSYCWYTEFCLVSPSSIRSIPQSEDIHFCTRILKISSALSLSPLTPWP